MQEFCQQNFQYYVNPTKWEHLKVSKGLVLILSTFIIYYYNFFSYSMEDACSFSYLCHNNNK